MTGGDARFSLVRGDWPSRLQQSIGLMPARGGLDVARRVAVLLLITWAPIALWATVTGRMLAGRVTEPLLQHFGVHARSLVAIPLLVVVGASLHDLSGRLVASFLSSGIVPPSERPRFDGVLSAVARLRDRAAPWIAIAALALGWVALRPIGWGMHEVEWAVDRAAAAELRFGFGAWWFAYVVRGVFVGLLLAFLWRIVLLGELLRRIAALRLSLVPSHPDRLAGLGFLKAVPRALAPGLLAMSAVAASRWGHDVAFHGVELSSLQAVAAGLVIGVAALGLAPVLAFAGVLRRTRARAVREYGVLAGEHGRRVHRRWITREPVDDRDGLLSAPELGPAADVASLYDAVTRTRRLPIDRTSLQAVLVPAVLPLVAVATIRIPVRDIVKALLQAIL